MANALNQAEYIPSLKKDAVETSAETWASGNTKTITNANVKSNSVIVIMHTSLPAGRWYVTPAAGSFVITSSDAETNATFKYRIF
jgi:hypothetical protein